MIVSTQFSCVAFVRHRPPSSGDPEGDKHANHRSCRARGSRSCLYVERRTRPGRRQGRSKALSVITDNAQVRVLRIHYGPHETSVRRSHPNSVMTYLTDGTIEFLLGNGKTITDEGPRPEKPRLRPLEFTRPAISGNTPFEAVLVELKGHGAAGKRSSRLPQRLRAWRGHEKGPVSGRHDPYFISAREDTGKARADVGQGSGQLKAVRPASRACCKVRA